MPKLDHNKLHVDVALNGGFKYSQFLIFNS